MRNSSKKFQHICYNKNTLYILPFSILFYNKNNRTAAKPVKLKPIYDLPERMRQRWEHMNVKRLTKTLLALKRFDPETIAMHIKPEKDRLAYNKLKQHAMEENFCNIQHEISDIRARLVPEQDADEEAERLELIQQNVNNMASAKMDGFQYNQIENYLNEVSFSPLNCRNQFRLEYALAFNLIIWKFCRRMQPNQLRSR